jgi:hypothetical protein
MAETVEEKLLRAADEAEAKATLKQILAAQVAAEIDPQDLADLLAALGVVREIHQRITQKALSSLGV